jgi:hypothetical protein
MKKYLKITCQKNTLLGLSAPDIDNRVEKIGPTLTPLKRLGDQLIVVR